MAYDRESFLAGVAVGRNMLGWPEMLARELPFIYVVTVDGSDARPLNLRIPSMLFNATDTNNWIDWGDGTIDNIPWSPVYNYPVHSYTAAGTYIIKISPTFTDIRSFENFEPLDRVITPIPEIGGLGLAPGSFFAGCVNLKSIPSGFFDAYTRIDADGLFEGCVSLQYIPRGLFANFPETSFSRTFSRCVSIKSIPDNLFGVGGVYPSSFVFTFEGCVGLREVPENLINKTNPGNTYGMFTGCSSLESIPDGFLKNCASLDSVGRMFEGSGLKSIPQTLFDDCPDITDFERTFADCVSITDNLPELWTQYTDPDVQTSQCFYRCINAPNYDQVPNAWKYSL